MKRLKSILLEDDNQELKGTLKNYKTNIKPLLYRATNHSVNQWDVKEIRKNRKPRDTHPIIHGMVTVFEEKRYQNYPKREQSKFAVVGYNEEELERYGAFHHVVFPEKNANIASVHGDAIRYFNKAENALKSISQGKKTNKLIKILREKGYNTSAKFISKLKNVGRRVEFESGVYHDVINFFGSNFKEILSEMKEFTAFDSDLMNISEIRTKLKHYRKIFVKIGKDRQGNYFGDLERGVQKDAEEVIFDGSTYIAIDKSFFSRSFSWNGSNWVLN